MQVAAEKAGSADGLSAMEKLVLMLIRAGKGADACPSPGGPAGFRSPVDSL